MKKTLLLTIILLVFFLNLLLLKSILVNFALLLIYFCFPVMTIEAFKKANKSKSKKDELVALSLWGIAIIPMLIFAVMVFTFGMPPEGYTFADMFK